MSTSEQNDLDELLAKPEIKEAEFETLFYDSLIGVVYVAKNGMFIKVNRKFAEMLGYSPKELERVKTYQDVTHPDDVETQEAESKDLVESKNDQYKINKRYLHKDAGFVWCTVQITPIKDRAGVFVHFVKQAQELRINQKYLSIDKDSAGHVSLRPKIEIVDFLVHNWKWVTTVAVPTLATALALIGTTISNHYEIKAQNEYKEKEIQRLQDQIKAIDAKTNK